MPLSKLSCPVFLGAPANSRGRSRGFVLQPPCGSRLLHLDEMCLEVFSTVWFTLCSTTVFQQSSSQLWSSGSAKPFMPAGYLIPELGSPMKSTSAFALASRLRARWCALRSRRNDTFTCSSPSSTSFGRPLGCPTGAGARLGSITDAVTVPIVAACTATSAACAVDACIIARFACCALRA